MKAGPVQPKHSKHDQHSVLVQVYHGRRLLNTFDLHDFWEEPLLVKLVRESDATSTSPQLTFMLSALNVEGHAPAQLLAYERGYLTHVHEDLRDCWRKWWRNRDILEAEALGEA